MIQKQKDFINEERGTKLVDEFLNLMQKRKTANKSEGTYGLKHVIEKWAGKKYGKQNNYIDEGLLINLAMEKGFKAVPAYINADKFNSCFLNISERSLNKLGPIEKYRTLDPGTNIRPRRGFYD